ncbi:MAG: ABC transporter permease [Idiomarina sp.]|nr:ABC transporter permease [Idiomarina sp.]
MTTQPAADASGVVVRLSGVWVLADYRAGQRELQAFASRHQDSEQVVTLDGREITRLDTSAAHLLYQFFGAQALEQGQFKDEHRNLVQLVLSACEQKSPLPPKPDNSLVALLAEVGEFCTNAFRQQKLLLGFLGQVLIRILQVLVSPTRWRITPLAAQIEQVGLNAVPIVALLTFLVGAVVAFLGATVLGDFGADIYTVNLVGFSFLREFGVLLAAILLAGRTASAFTAQLGSMKANEEIDALRAQGLDPLELLVVPRVLAMMISLPALTILAMVSGVAGGMLVCWLALDISPQLFMYIFARDIDISHFWSGLVKAPVFAFMIGLIGCLEGFKVAGSAQSVGEHTTSSVVQSIFMVILLDALFALFFMEIGW